MADQSSQSERKERNSGLDFPKLKIMVENASEMTAEARALSEKCRDYYSGEQWTPAEIAALQRRKQPVITINRIQRKVDAMVGIEQRSRVDPRAYPRNPSQEAAADVATKALVYVDDATRFDSIRSEAFENLIVEGYGGVEIIVEEKRGQFEVVVNRLRWEEIFFDPHSREKDFSDATYLGCMKWMSLDNALELYEGAFEGSTEELEQLLLPQSGSLVDGETYDDRPERDFKWADKRQQRVRVAQMYYKRRGVWHLAILGGGGEILNTVSPYVDEDGQPTCPIVLMTAYIDRDNRRFGVVKSMLSAQDEVNKRRSKLLHLLSVRQTSAVKGAVSVEHLKRELASPDGHVEVDPSMADSAREMGMPAFQVLPTADMAAGQFNLLVESKDEIDKLGPNASLIGQLQGQQSGRAIMAQQQAGLVELAPLYDSLRDWTLRCYRQMWMRIRQFWTEERWIRVTDEFEAPQFLAINQIVGYDEFGQPVMENAVAQMDLDIIVSDAPDYVTLRQEQFEQLTQMAQAGIQVPPELIIEASDIRDKRRVIEAMQQAQQQAAMAQAQAAEQQGMLEQAKIEGDLVLKQAQAQKYEADAMKAQASIPKIEAEGQGEQADALVKRLSLRTTYGI